jgi:hypothetical protein
MGPSANVTSIAALGEFRAYLGEFIEAAKDALCANDMEIQRAFAWLDEQTRHWQKELRVRQEEFELAKRNLKQRQLMKTEGRIPDTTEQEEALQLATRRLREAEEKLSNCRRWSRQLRREVDEYLGPARLLSGIVEVDLAKASALLERKVETLEAYVGLAPPVTPGSVPAGGIESAKAGEAPPAGEMPPKLV